MKMRMMFYLMSLFIILISCEPDKKEVKNNKLRSESFDNSFLQVKMKNTGPSLEDSLAKDDKYEPRNTRKRMEEDYMGDGLSEEEKLEQFKKVWQNKRPSYHFN